MLQLSEPLLQWLESLPLTVPLHAVTASSGSIDTSRLAKLISESRLPTDSMITAMLWLRIGVIDRPHAIVQDGTTPIASYLHGVVHRLEGEYWNSKYWFKQVGDARVLQAVSHAINERLNQEGSTAITALRKIMQGNVFTPLAFVSACERAHQQTKPDDGSLAQLERALLERVSWIEWKSLWDWICNDLQNV